MGDRIDKQNMCNLKPTNHVAPSHYFKSDNPYAFCIWIDSIANQDGRLTEEDFEFLKTNIVWKDYVDDIRTKLREICSFRVFNPNLRKVDVMDSYSTEQGTLSIKVEKTQLQEDVINHVVIKDKNTSQVLSEKVIKSLYCSATDSNQVKMTIKRTSLDGRFVREKDISFSYSKNEIENYIINAKDAPRFSKINEIREKLPEKQTNEEKALLNEFENLVNNVIAAGLDYGIDPNFIISIIHQEVKFEGLSSRVTGKNGKGYMQLTTAPIADYLGLAEDKKYHATKKDKYGPEVEELLLSRGFDPNCSNADKKELTNQIVNYLIENKDAEFNIRLGTLILRQYVDNAKGDFWKAAKNYNGNKELQNEYANKVVNKYYKSLESTVLRDSTYIVVFKRNENNSK